MGASAAGGGLKMFGEYESGVAAQNKARYQQSVALMNAQIDEQNRAYAMFKGEVDSQRKGEEWAQRIAGFRAGSGARGLDVNTGSSSAIVKSMGDLAGHDQATIRSNAAWSAYAMDVKKSQDIADAGMYGAAATSAKAASLISMAGTGMETLGSVADKWYKYQADFPQDKGAPGWWVPAPREEG
jgi:hypothetical protein